MTKPQSETGKAKRAAAGKNRQAGVRVAAAHAKKSADRDRDADRNEMLSKPTGTAVTDEIARLFGFELPYDLDSAVDRIEAAISAATLTRKNVVLLFDEDTGTYHVFNDQRSLEAPEREVSLISDHFLQALLDSSQVLQIPLIHGDVLVGILAVADKLDRKAFQAEDEARLEATAAVLTRRLLAFRVLKESLALPYVQGILLDIARDLISGVDRNTIVAHMLRSLLLHLGVDVAQYIHFETGARLGESLEGIGAWMYEQRAETNQLETASVSQARLPQRLGDVQSLVSLFGSRSWLKPYLQLSTAHLGGKPIEEVFVLPGSGIRSGIVVPIRDGEQVRGLVNLFFTHEGGQIGDTQATILKDAAELIAEALKRAELYDQLSALSQRDELTGLLNRRGLAERFEAEWSRARRQGQPLSVAILDLDHFKQINDRHGHHVGDAVLQTLARLLYDNLRRSDVIARIGGEEFAIILPDTPLEIATKLMNRLRGRVERHNFPSIGRAVTLSAGLVDTEMVSSANKTHLPEAPQEALDALLDEADRRLYHAKAHGRNRVVTSIA